MFDLLEKGPLQELYNVIFYTVKGSFKFNHARYTETKSEQLATKIWPMINDWEALLIPQKNTKQLVTVHTVYRILHLIYLMSAQRLLENANAG